MKILSGLQSSLGRKSDKAMEDVIVQAWQFSQSHPWPGEWLDECRRQLKQEAEGNLDEARG